MLGFLGLQIWTSTVPFSKKLLSLSQEIIKWHKLLIEKTPFKISSQLSTLLYGKLIFLPNPQNESVQPQWEPCSYGHSWLDRGLGSCDSSCTNWIASLRYLELELKGANWFLLPTGLRACKHWLGHFSLCTCDGAEKTHLERQREKQGGRLECLSSSCFWTYVIHETVLY